MLDDSTAEWDDDSLTRIDLFALAPDTRRPLLEAHLQAQVARMAGVAPSRLNPRQSIGVLGLDSLMAVELQHRIEMSLGVVVPITTFLQGISIADLAAEILDQLAAPLALLQKVLAPASAPLAEHPLSYGQRALWFLHQLAPQSAAYNIASAVRIRSDLDIPALRRTFQRLVERHAALRTTFVAHQGDPVQQVHAHLDICFLVEDAAGWSEATLDDRLVEEAHHPFDLEYRPLLRVYVVKQTAQTYILLLVVHHLVADFWSLAVLAHELSVIYAAETGGVQAALTAHTFHYADYVRWQAEMLASPEGDRLWAYWRSQLAGPLPVLNLPTDRPRPTVQTFHGRSCTFTLSATLAQQLRALAQTEGATLYMILLAAFQLLLQRYTGQDDILVGSPAAGRCRAMLADLIGYFVNPVVLRTDLTGNLTFKDVLGRVRRTVLAALDHQDYPFALLVERLQPDRDPSRSPIFEVMFILEKSHRAEQQSAPLFIPDQAGSRLNLGSLELEAIELKQRAVQFDLVLMIEETHAALSASLQYNTDLFDAASIERMARHFQTLLASSAADPDRCAAELPLLIAAEQQQVLVEWNATHVAYPGESCIQQLFEAQAARTPDAIACLAMNDER